MCWSDKRLLASHIFWSVESDVVELRYLSAVGWQSSISGHSGGHRLQFQRTVTRADFTTLLYTVMWWRSGTRYCSFCELKRIETCFSKSCRLNGARVLYTWVYWVLSLHLGFMQSRRYKKWTVAFVVLDLFNDAFSFALVARVNRVRQSMVLTDVLERTSKEAVAVNFFLSIGRKGLSKCTWYVNWCCRYPAWDANRAPSVGEVQMTVTVQRQSMNRQHQIETNQALSGLHPNI
jgi:hypothetical protein